MSFLAFDLGARLSWKWRERSPVKITERTNEEATALGNIAMQMLATGAVASLAEARQVIDRFFPVERFEPSDPDRWNSQYRRFQDYVEPVGV